MYLLEYRSKGQPRNNGVGVRLGTVQELPNREREIQSRLLSLREYQVCGTSDKRPNQTRTRSVGRYTSYA